MFITNEQIASAIDRTPTIIKSSLQDFEFFLQNTNDQIISTLQDGMLTASERVKLDLEDIDKLLGEPIQKEISVRTEIDAVFESILNICTIKTDIIQRVQLLRQTLSNASKIAQNASIKMEDLQIQLSVLQRQCIPRDRPLCDTLRLKNFDEMGIASAVNKLKTDPILLRMLNLGEAEINNSWRNLSSELYYARSKFRSYPIRIQQETEKQRLTIIRELNMMKEAESDATRTLTNTIQYLMHESNQFWDLLQKFFHNLHKVGIFMWGISLSICLLILLVTLILLGALSCSCCHADNRTGVSLVLSAIIMSLASIILVVFTMFTMLVGGHGEVFLCRPLYDYPNYSMLERLFNKPGLIYEHEKPYGIFDNLLRPPGHTTDIFNISLSSIIKYIL